MRAEFLEGIHFPCLFGKGDDVPITGDSQRFAIMQFVFITDCRPAIMPDEDRHIHCLPRQARITTVTPNPYAIVIYHRSTQVSRKKQYSNASQGKQKVWEW